LGRSKEEQDGEKKTYADWVRGGRSNEVFWQGEKVKALDVRKNQ